MAVQIQRVIIIIKKSTAAVRMNETLREANTLK